MGIVKNNSLSWESTLPPVEPLPPGPINPFDNKLTDEFSCAVVPLTASPGPLSVKPVPEEGTNVSEPAVIGSAETVAVVRKQTAKRTAATMGDLMDSMRTPVTNSMTARLLVYKTTKGQSFPLKNWVLRQICQAQW